MLHNFHRHHLFFRHKQINEIYVSIFIMKLAETMISLFVPIYLYSLHYSLVKIIIFFFIGNLISVVGALPAAKLVARLGAKHSILASIPLLILYYLGLRFLPIYPTLFFILPFLSAIQGLLYNFGFDLNFITHADRNSLGREISFIHILTILASVVSPLLAGLIITIFGYNLLFLSGSTFLVLSLLPLFASEDSYRRLDFDWRDVVNYAINKKQLGMTLSFVGYAIESSIGLIIWPLFLIIILGVAEKVGYVAALSATITVVILSVTGTLTDRFNTRKLMRFGTMLYFLGWIGSVFVDSTLKVFFADSYLRVSGRFLMVPWEAAFYRHMQPKVYFRSVVARNMTFNGSRVLILPFIMAVFVFTSQPFIIAFIIASLFTLLYPFIGNVKEEKAS